jgi:hypothetical protein
MRLQTMMPARRWPVRFAVAPIVLSCVLMTGCGGGRQIALSSRQSVNAAASLPAGVPRTFVGADNAPGATVGLFATSTGQLIRQLTTDSNAGPVALSGDGRSVYISNQRQLRRPCTERVRLATGRAHRLAFCATGLAVSPDNRMLAYTAESANGLTVKLFIRDRQTGRHRSLVLDRLCKGCNNGVDGAGLSWSPNDRYLAVSIAYTASIQDLHVLPAWHGTLRSAREVAQCDGEKAICMNQSYAPNGGLIYTQIGPRHQIVREVSWSGRHLTVLHRFTGSQADVIPVVVDSAGTAFLWHTVDEHGPQHTYLWVNDRVHALHRSVRTEDVLPELWH